MINYITKCKSQLYKPKNSKYGGANMIDMLEVKKDRLKALEKQIKYNVYKKDWTEVYKLRHEQRELKENIRNIEINRFKVSKLNNAYSK